MADDLRIIVLEGDETGQELLDQAIRVLDPGVTKVDLKLEHYDLSLDNRRKTSNEVVTKAARAMADAFCSAAHMSEWAKAGGRWR